MRFAPLRLLFLWAATALPLAPEAVAQTRDDFQGWFQFLAQGKLADPLLGFLDIQARPSVEAGGLNLFILRPALGVQILPSLSTHLGWMWAPVVEPRYRNENRIWQQLTHQFPLGSFHIFQRFRQEQRFLGGTDEISHRSRYMLRVTHPFAHESDWLALVYDEVFVHLNTVAGGPAGGFDQNRLALGFNKGLGPLFRLDLVYLLQYVYRSTAADSLNHVAMGTLYLNF